NATMVGTNGGGPPTFQSFTRSAAGALEGPDTIFAAPGDTFSDAFTVARGSGEGVYVSEQQDGANPGNEDVVASVGTPPPVITTAPEVLGAGQAGAPLACSTGDWRGAPTSFAFVWRSNGSAIPGADTSVYVPTDVDIGNLLDCVVTATNAAGSASA